MSIDDAIAEAVADAVEDALEEAHEAEPETVVVVIDAEPAGPSEFDQIMTRLDQMQEQLDSVLALQAIDVLAEAEPEPEPEPIIIEEIEPMEDVAPEPEPKPKRDKAPKTGKKFLDSWWK